MALYVFCRILSGVGDGGAGVPVGAGAGVSVMIRADVVEPPAPSVDEDDDSGPGDRTIDRVGKAEGVGLPVVDGGAVGVKTGGGMLGRSVGPRDGTGVSLGKTTWASCFAITASKFRFVKLKSRL